MSRTILALAIMGSYAVAAQSTADEVSLHNNAVIRLATENQAREMLAKRDRFVTTLSPFDRQSRVETDKQISEEEFIDFVGSHVRPWSEVERTKLTGVIERLRPKLAGFKLPFPPAVWLIKTTGREEGNAAYCRGPAIVLPQDKVHTDDLALERLLTHELFHILSAHDPEWRAMCYKLIGFRSVAAVEFPESLRDRKITNPDGPLLDSVIDVMVEGKSRPVVPILYSERAFDPTRGGPFFKYVTFRLLVVEEHAAKWRPAMLNGEPWLLTPGQAPDFGRQIGSNTGYIIHPDEILADNFVHLVFQTPGLRSPEIVQRLREALSE